MRRSPVPMAVTACASRPASALIAVLESTAAYSLAGVRVGIPHECHVEGMSDAALSSWRDAAAALAAAGATLTDVSIPAIEASLAACLRHSQCGGEQQPGALRRRPAVQP